MPSGSDVLHRPFGPPWLIIFGQGVESEELASTIRGDCAAHGITTRQRSIDDLAGIELAYYPSLVLSLPVLPLTSNVAAALRPYADVIQSYRHRRPRGLTHIRSGRLEWFEAGVLQVAGERALLQHRVLRNTLEQACWVHDLDQDPLVDPMRPYQSAPGVHGGPPRTVATDVAFAALREVWNRVGAWRIDDLDQVPKIFACINTCRSYYENPRFPQLYRPIPELPRNRLDIILDGPADTVVGDRKAWQENGARVWRYVRDRIVEVVPSFVRPGNGKNKKDAVKALADLYRDLKILDEHLASATSPDTVRAFMIG
jgi:hypothetical protein